MSFGLNALGGKRLSRNYIIVTAAPQPLLEELLKGNQFFPRYDLIFASVPTPGALRLSPLFAFGDCASECIRVCVCVYV